MSVILVARSGLDCNPNNMNIQQILTLVVSVFAFVLAWVAFRYNKRRDAALDHSKEIEDLTVEMKSISNMVNAVQREVSHLQGAHDSTWRILEVYAGKTLHRHNDLLGIDYYLDRSEDLTQSEAQEFVYKLAAIAESQASDGTKMAATVKLAAIMRRYRDYHLEVPGV